MLSRAAESIFWMSRYIERAENIARFIDVNMNLMLDRPPGFDEQWMPLIMTTAGEDAFSERYGEPTKDNVIQFLTFDEKNPNSIVSCLSAARENARSIREAISSEMWEQVNGFYLMLRDPSARRQMTDSPHSFFNEVKKASHLFVGITYTTMSHGEGWHFIRLGRMLERADQTSRIIDVKYFILLPDPQDVGNPFDQIQWMATLQSTSGGEMYRKRYHHITPGQVMEFLILDHEFPRSIYYCILGGDESLHAISGSPQGSFVNPAEQSLGRLQAELAYTRIDDILTQGMHEFLDSLQIRLNRVGEAISRTFFESQPLPSEGAPVFSQFQEITI